VDHSIMTKDQKINRFIELTQVQKDLEAQLSPVKDELGELRSDLAREFAGCGDTRITRNGYTLYVKRELSVKSAGGDTAALCDALRRSRLSHLISPSMQSIKAWLKDRFHDPATDTWEVDMRKLPPSLQDKFEIGEYTQISARKA